MSSSRRPRRTSPDLAAGTVRHGRGVPARATSPDLAGLTYVAAKSAAKSCGEVRPRSAEVQRQRTALALAYLANVVDRLEHALDDLERQELPR